MRGFEAILLSLVPVYLFIATGFVCRILGWLTPASDSSYLKMQVNVLYPALIFSLVFRNEALNQTSLLVIPPIVGAGTILVGFLLSYWFARVLGYERGKGLRTFSYTTGIYNYGFLAIPLCEAVFKDMKILGTLMVFNTGIEFAIWTVGLLLLTGSFQRDCWKKLLNPPVIALLAAMLLHFILRDIPTQSNLPGRTFDSLIKGISWLGQCAIPLALILVGASIRDLLSDKNLRPDWKVILSGSLMRLGLLPLLFLGTAILLPLPYELKAVLVIQAAMPSGMFPILMARHYGGSPHVAVQIVLATTALSFITIPLWVMLGLHWLGQP